MLLKKGSSEAMLENIRALVEGVHYGDRGMGSHRPRDLKKAHDVATAEAHRSGRRARSRKK